MSDQDNTSLPPLQDDNNVSLDDLSSPSPMPPDLPGPSSPSVTNINIPEEAADIDLIEKEWVIKAKQIVEQTSENPYKQQQEIAKMKTEYIKKRYKRNVEL